MDRAAPAPQQLTLEAAPLPILNHSDAVMSRRNLLKLAGLGGSAVVLGACSGEKIPRSASTEHPINLPIVGERATISPENSQIPSEWGSLEDHWPVQNVTPEPLNMGRPLSDSAVINLNNELQDGSELSEVVGFYLNGNNHSNTATHSTPVYWMPQDGGQRRLVNVVTSSDQNHSMLIMVEDLSATNESFQDYNDRLIQIADNTGDWTEHEFELEGIQPYAIISLKNGGFDIIVFNDQFDTSTKVVRIMGSIPVCVGRSSQECRTFLDNFIYDLYSFAKLNEVLK